MAPRHRVYNKPKKQENWNSIVSAPSTSNPKTMAPSLPKKKATICIPSENSKKSRRAKHISMKKQHPPRKSISVPKASIGTPTASTPSRSSNHTPHFYVASTKDAKIRYSTTKSKRLKTIWLSNMARKCTNWRNHLWRNPSTPKTTRSVSTIPSRWAEAARSCSERSKIAQANTKPTKIQSAETATTSTSNFYPPTPSISRSTPSDHTTCMPRHANHPPSMA